MKGILLAALAITLLIVITACSTAELTSSEPTATWDDVVKTRMAARANQPTRTPIPTSTPYFIPQTPTLLATAGPSPTPEPTSTPEPTPTPNPLAGELAPVLLAVEDLPTGWTVSQAGLDVELTRTDNICGVNISDPAVVDMVAEYEGGMTGPFASQSLSLYDSAGNAAAVFAQIRDAYSACPSEGFSYADGSWAAIAPISFPVVGDESLALRMSVGAEGLEFEADLIIFRVDEVLTIISYADLSALIGAPGDPAHLETIVRGAEARIHAHAAHIDAIQVPSQAI